LVGLLAVLIIGGPGRIDRQKQWQRIVTGIVIAFITVANLFSAARLFRDILTNNKLFANHPTGLLATGGVICATSVIAFGLWYWDLDATAFSPTDTSAVKRWAKLLMIVEACVSLGIVGLVISRAINILK
jgi:hypothetical protein